MAVTVIKSVGASPADADNINAAILAASNGDTIQLQQKDANTPFELGSGGIRLGGFSAGVDRLDTELTLEGVNLRGQKPVLNGGTYPIWVNTSKPLIIKNLKIIDGGQYSVFVKWVMEDSPLVVDGVDVINQTGAAYPGAFVIGILIGSQSAVKQIKSPVEVKNCYIDLEAGPDTIDRTAITPGLQTWTPPTYDADGSKLTDGVADPNAWISFGIFCHMSTPTGFVHIHDNVIKNQSANGIESGRQECTAIIENNELLGSPYNSRYRGIRSRPFGIVSFLFLGYTPGPAIIRNNKITCLGTDSSGIWIGGQAGNKQPGCVITQNEIISISDTSMIGILTSGIDRAFVSQNKISGPFRVGLQTGHLDDSRDFKRPLGDRIWGADYNVFEDNDLDDLELIETHTWPIKADVFVTGNALSNMFTGKNIHQKLFDDRGRSTKIL